MKIHYKFTPVMLLLNTKYLFYRIYNIYPTHHHKSYNVLSLLGVSNHGKDEQIILECPSKKYSNGLTQTVKVIPTD